jgi:hypothetical protein
VARRSGYEIKIGIDVDGAWQDRPLDFLTELTKTTDRLLEKLRADGVAAARAQGASWEQIGKALGVSRQAAWNRFAER